MKSLLLALLFSVSALAQPVVGPEVTSAPLANLDDYAITPQRDGFVLAWTAEGRPFAAHLDGTLHVTAPPLDLPLLDPAASAVLPAVASNGTSVLVIWHERRRGYGETAFMAVLSADARTLVKGPQLLNFTTNAPMATTVNGKYVVYSGDMRYVFNENLDTEAGAFISRNLGATLTGNGEVATVTESSSGHFDCHQVCYYWCPVPPTPSPCTATSTVTFLFDSAFNAFTYSFLIPPNSSSADPFVASPPVLAPNGDSYAGLVQLPGRTDLYPRPSEQVTLPVPVLGQTALAGNGSDVLLVWTTAHLTGIVRRGDGTISEPFTIAPAGFQPKVVSINSNDFAVLYRTDFDPQHSSIVARIVHLQTPRRRGIR